MEEAFEDDLTEWFRRESTLLRNEIVKDLQRELGHLENSSEFRFLEDSYAAMFAVLMLLALVGLCVGAYKGYQLCRRHVGLRPRRPVYYSADGRRAREVRRPPQ